MTTNLVYRSLGTPVTFKDSGGTVALTLQNLGFGAGRVSAQWDRGAGDLPYRYTWKAVVQFETAPAVGELVDIYLFESDGSLIDGNVGTADAALTAVQCRNGKCIGSIYVQTADTATNFIASGVCYIWQRYASVGVWNGSAGDNFKNTANTSSVTLTPAPDSIQAAA